MIPLDQYPTPETDAAIDRGDRADLINIARDLEQRLAACRQALEDIISDSRMPKSMCILTPASIAMRAIYETTTQPQ